MDSLAKTRDCHENHAMLRFLSNDEKSFSCHTELLTKSEVSQMQSKNRDISFASLTQYDKENAQYDNIISSLRAIRI